MNPTTLQDIISHARTEYPRESCGLVVVVKGKERYLPCRNTADDPTRGFVIHPEDATKAEELAGEVMMLAHSHPNQGSAMSVPDRVMCNASEMPWVIVGIDPDGKCEVTVHEPDDYVAPLVGRPFHHGVLDCYALVRDYYQREFGITLADFERQDDWWNKGQDLYMDNLTENGWSPIKGAPRKGDMILMQVRSPVVNHAGIFIGEPDHMLHHMHGRLSTREVYGGSYQEMTRCIVRHKDLP